MAKLVMTAIDDAVGGTGSRSDSGALSIQEIMRLLPHRYPFLLVDRVTECVPGNYIRGYKNIARNESLFASSGFAKEMPRLLAIEALAQLAVILTFRTLVLQPSGDERIFFAGIDRAQFTGTVRSGDTLLLEARTLRLMRQRGIGKFETMASVGKNAFVRAEMIAALRLSPAEAYV